MIIMIMMIIIKVVVAKVVVEVGVVRRVREIVAIRIIIH